MNYLLMNKDNIVAVLSFKGDEDSGSFSVLEQTSTLPIGFKDINKWLEGRQAAKHRKHLERLMRQCGCYSILGYIRIIHCVGINDTFWVKRDGESVTWKDVSLYDNDFDNTITRIAFEGVGLYGDTLSSTTPEFSMEGSYEKCCIREGSNLCIIKRGTDGFANVGLEPYSEVFSYPIYQHITGAATGYELVNYHGKIASKCKVFTDNDLGFVSASRVIPSSNLKDIEDYYKGIGFYDTLCAMLVADAVCYNSDRHMGNYGFLFDTNTLNILCPSPVFDHNLTLVPYAMKSDFPTIYTYISEQGPRIGQDWVRVARSHLTSGIRSRLISLKGYEIPFKGNDKFTSERVQLLNRLINEQIERILE